MTVPLGDPTGTRQVLPAKTDPPFTSDAEIAELVRLFESCELPGERWTHRAHLAVAASYLRALSSPRGHRPGPRHSPVQRPRGNPPGTTRRSRPVHAAGRPRTGAARPTAWPRSSTTWPGGFSRLAVPTLLEGPAVVGQARAGFVEPDLRPWTSDPHRRTVMRRNWRGSAPGHRGLAGDRPGDRRPRPPGGGCA